MLFNQRIWSNWRADEMPLLRVQCRRMAKQVNYWEVLSFSGSEISWKVQLRIASSGCENPQEHQEADKVTGKQH